MSSAAIGQRVNLVEWGRYCQRGISEMQSLEQHCRNQLIRLVVSLHIRQQQGEAPSLKSQLCVVCVQATARAANKYTKFFQCSFKMSQIMSAPEGNEQKLNNTQVMLGSVLGASLAVDLNLNPQEFMEFFEFNSKLQAQCTF